MDKQCKYCNTKENLKTDRTGQIFNVCLKCYIKNHPNYNKNIKLDYMDKDWLYRQYIELKQTMGQIAKKCNISPQNISIWLKKHQIPFRNKKENNKIIYQNQQNGVLKKYKVKNLFQLSTTVLNSSSTV